MSTDPPMATMARLFKSRTFRVDRETGTLSWSPPRHWDQIALLALAILFVLVGAIDLDLGPAEARLGLAAGERPGPLGQVVGYWAADLWPAEVLPSYLLAQLEPGGRPSSAAVRWPAAFAGILAGWILSRRTARYMGTGAGMLAGLCWFGSIALIDRSGALGIDLIVGLATLAALDRLITRGAGWTAGAVGITGVPVGRVAAALDHRPGDRCGGTGQSALLASTRHPTARYSRLVVDLDFVCRVVGTLCIGAHAAVHSKAGVAPGPECDWPGASVWPVRGSRAVRLDARAVEPRCSDLDHGMVSGGDRAA